MFSPNKAQVDELKRLAFLSDKEIRGDLVAGYIRDEDDYTANFTGALRRNINCYSKTKLQATSLMLGTSDERLTGCDATIIVTSNNESKVMLFEAKYPRFKKTNFRWDYPQTAGGLSHFSDQLARQSKYSGKFAIFEMFYNEHPFASGPPHLQAEVSSCAWYSDSQTFDLGRSSGSSPWTTAELNSMLKKGNTSIAEIIEDVCACKAGHPISMAKPESIVSEFGLPGNVLVVNFGNQSQEVEG